MTDGTQLGRLAARLLVAAALAVSATGCRPFPLRPDLDPVAPTLSPTTAATSAPKKPPAADPTAPAVAATLLPTPAPAPLFDPIQATASEVRSSLALPATATDPASASAPIDPSVSRALMPQEVPKPDMAPPALAEPVPLDLTPAAGPAPMADGPISAVMTAAPPASVRAPIFPAPDEPKPDPAASTATVVTVTEPDPIAMPAPAPPPPAETWDEGLERLRGVVRSRSNEPGTPESAWSLRAMVLDGLAQAEGINTTRSLARDAAPPRGEDVRRAVEAIESEAPAEIVSLAWCRKVFGFGEFEPLSPDPSAASPTLTPGQPSLLYCEVSGVRYEPDATSPAGLLRSRLASSLEVTPADGGPVAWRHTDSTVDHCSRRRRDFFITYQITLPSHLPAGKYTLRLSQTDEVAGRSTSRSIDFEVRPGR